MVLKPEPVFEAVESLQGPGSRVILLSPAGRPYRQSLARELSRADHLILLCGSYEGFDERIVEGLAGLSLSIGDYVLTNGALPAMVVVDSVCRLLPGALGDEASAQEGVLRGGGAPGASALHPPGGLPGHEGAGHPPLGGSRSHRPVEEADVHGADPEGQAGTGPRGSGTVGGGPRGKMNQELLRKIEAADQRSEPLEFSVGDTVRVHTRVVEGDKERIQVFSGIVIGRRGRGTSERFTVRRISYGEGIERVFPVNSPRIAKLDVERRGSVRRAKLTYLRKRIGKAAMLVKEKDMRGRKKAAR